MKLVHVIWEDDEGVVDVTTGKVVMYAFDAESVYVDDTIPAVVIENSDFPDPEEPTWDEVPTLPIVVNAAK